jgi:hypothetical protein
VAVTAERNVVGKHTGASRTSSERGSHHVAPPRKAGDAQRIVSGARAIRFGRTDARAQYVLDLYRNTTSTSVKRACMDCWRIWRDRSSFTRDRNRWSAMSEEEKRMLWLAAGSFGRVTGSWGCAVQRKMAG